MRVTFEIADNEAAAFFDALGAFYAKFRAVVKDAGATVANIAKVSTEIEAPQPAQRTPFNVDDLATPAKDIPSVPDSETKRRRGRPKADHQAPLDPPPSPALVAPVTPPPIETKPTAAVTIETLRMAGNALVAKKGAHELTNILKAFKNKDGSGNDARRYPDVDEAQWSDLLSKITTAAA